MEDAQTSPISSPIQVPINPNRSELAVTAGYILRKRLLKFSVGMPQWFTGSALSFYKLRHPMAKAARVRTSLLTLLFAIFFVIAASSLLGWHDKPDAMALHNGLLIAREGRRKCCDRHIQQHSPMERQRLELIWLGYVNLTACVYSACIVQP
jgi:hypothetical protein